MGRTAKDKRDLYYRCAKEEGLRARSAYKLQQIDDRLGILASARRVVDLCAAPGSWCQVMSQRCGPDATIVAVDLQEITPISPQVRTVIGDITAQSTVDALHDALGGGPMADLVVMDGAPDVLHIHDFDEYIQHELVYASLNFAVRVLAPGGSFVAKLFRGPNAWEVYRALFAFFASVLVCKPRACRVSSPEVFVVARGLRAPAAQALVGPVLAGTLDGDPFGVRWRAALQNQTAEECPSVPYLLCGASDAPDSNKNYDLGEDYESLPPVQPPIRAPYEDAVRRKRGLAPQPQTLSLKP